MADDDSDKDPLSRLAIPFLGLIAFTWALVFGLLIVHLRGREWQGLDDTALILLAFLLGIALLPFVSQFSVAGLFEFRREINQLSDNVDAVRNDVASLASAVAVAKLESTTSQTQQVSLDLSGIEGRVATAVQNQLSDVVKPTAQPLESTESGETAWRIGWSAFRTLAAIEMLADKIAAEDLTLPLDQYMDFREAFRTAADRLVADATKLSNVRQLVQGLIDFAESVDANEELSREQYVSAVKDLGTATGQATARIIGSGFVGAAALHEVVNDRDAALRFALKMAPFLETTKAEEA